MIENLMEVSPNIPRELIKDKKKWYSLGTHIVNVVEYNYPLWWEYYPPGIMRLICKKAGDHNGKHLSKRRHGLPACGECYGIPTWFTSFCVACGGVFVTDFSDPKFCSLYPTCYNCLPELPWTSCPDHPRLDYSTIPPSGLNPRKFTAEEIADAFAFLNE